MRSKVPEYRWSLDGDKLILRERWSIKTYTKQQLEEAISNLRAADRPTVKCGYQFERDRALRLAKLQAGLDLLARNKYEK